MEKNTVTVGGNEALFSRSLRGNRWNWYPFPALTAPMRVTAKIRHSQLDFPAVVTPEAEGFARVDCFLRPDGEIVFNEVNTIPGFTAHSRYPNMMKAAGLSFTDLVTQVIELAVKP